LSSPSFSNRDPFPEIVNKIPDDDEVILQITKVWVNKLMSDLGICPFTSGADRAGLPMGDVFYCIDRSTTMEDVYARYWKEVVRVEQQPERDLATTLLILPEFCMDNIDLFESFMNTLTQPLAALGVEDLLQLVFFHPHYVFRDGAQRSGKAAGAANYARRSPWPMINLLRTSQVRTAQRGIPTGLVYQQNEKTLTSIGSDSLETMLRLRNWDDIADVKVDRRAMEALRLAQDFQLTGQVQAKDLNVQDDATPAVNKVAKEQVEQGNLVKVMIQALEKRLGIIAVEGAPTWVTTLSGPETSATVMASDFVLNELDRIVATATATAAPATSTATAVVSTTTTTEAVVSPHRLSREEEARRLILEDLYGAEHTPPSEDKIGGDTEWRVLMGQGGIGQGKDDDEDRPYSAGMNPHNFY
jgi:hypothetical protein